MKIDAYKLLGRVRKTLQSLIVITKMIHISEYNKNIISQLLRSITSIGANYAEVIEAESRRDFIHKISLYKKECTESIYWFELLIATSEKERSRLSKIRSEVYEYVKIYSKSLSTLKKGQST